MQTQQRDRGVPLDEWAGSFKLPGLDTRVRLGGFVVTEAIVSRGTMASKGQFITASIATGPNAPRVPGGLGFTINHSRVGVESRTMLGHRLLDCAVTYDFFNKANDLTPDIRCRALYAQMDDVVFGGGLLIGQNWSTIADLEAFPETLDPEGPNSYYGVRRTLVRWSRRMTPNMHLLISAEQPEKHKIENAVSRQGRPDLVLAFEWDRDPVRLKWSFTSRELVGSNGNVQRTTGAWGVGASTKVGFRAGRYTDYVIVTGVYGKGVGSDMNDSPADGIYVADPTGIRVLAIPTVGGYFSYQHNWSPEFYSAFCHGRVFVDNLSVQPGSAYRTTQYTTANLIWQPRPEWLIGIEGQWGYRRDLNGNAGSASRVQLTTRYNF